MGNSGDIYSQGKGERESVRNGRLNRPDENRKHKNSSRAMKEKTHKSASGKTDRDVKNSKRRKWRKALLSLLALGLAVYASYCGFVAVKGFPKYKGISLGEMTIQNIFKSDQNAKQDAPRVSDQSSQAGRDTSLQRFVDRASQTERLQKDMIDLLNKGLASQAITRMQNADNPLHTSKIVEMLADANMQEENYVAAIEHFKELLKRNPDNLDARLELAEALFALEQFEEAKVVAEWALDLDPESLQALNMAADCYMKAGEIQVAIKLYREILAKNPNDEKTRGKLGMAYYHSGEYRRAIRYLDKMVREGTDNSLVYYNLAACYARQGIVEKAIETLKRAERKFGSSFVRTWVQGEDFKELRDSSKFRIFVSKIGQDTNVTNLEIKREKDNISIDIDRSPIQLDNRTHNLINRDR